MLEFPTQVGESDSDSYTDSSDDEKWSGRIPADALVEGGSGPEDGKGEEVAMHTGDGGDQVPRRNDYMEETSFLKTVKPAAVIDCNIHADVTCTDEEGEATQNLNCESRPCNEYGPTKGRCCGEKP